GGDTGQRVGLLVHTFECFVACDETNEEVAPDTLAFTGGPVVDLEAGHSLGREAFGQLSLQGVELGAVDRGGLAGLDHEAVAVLATVLLDGDVRELGGVCSESVADLLDRDVVLEVDDDGGPTAEARAPVGWHDER